MVKELCTPAARGMHRLTKMTVFLQWVEKKCCNENESSQENYKIQFKGLADKFY